MRNILRFLILLLAVPFGAYAGGYQVNLVGIRYIGMGHIGTAISQDAGAIFFNPGNLGFLKNKYSFSGGASAIIAYSAFQKSQSDYTAATESPISPPFSIFGSVKITDKFSAGLGIYTPFGSSVKWNKDWAGKYLIRDIKLQTILTQPTVSYKINDMFSVGAGLVIAYGKVELNKAIPVNSADMDAGNAQLTGKTTNLGFNAGIGIKPTDKLSFGISYRSKIMMNVKDGDAKFTVPSALETNFPSTTFDASIPLPSNLNLGVAYEFEKLTLGLDVNFVQWSAYDSLIFDFKENTTSLSDSRDPKKYKNTSIVRIGGQYKINDKLTVRLGTYYDASPVHNDYMSPETPDNNGIGVSGGLSFFPIEKLSIDASFLYINKVKRTGNYDPDAFGGTYKSLAYIPGIGVNYSF
jgi:long-chain fatty acid transport protein